MRRTILTEELIKQELEINHSGCKSSFSTIISQELAAKRENLITETAETVKRLEQANALAEQAETQTRLLLERERMLSASSTFQSTSTAVPIEENGSVTLQRSYVDGLYEETRRYRQVIEELRYQLQSTEAARQQLLEYQVENYQRQVGPSRSLPQTAPPPDRPSEAMRRAQNLYTTQESIRRLSDREDSLAYAFNEQELQPHEDNIDETTSKV